jgi:thiol-disulfide isomerase/thioredoxin
MILRAEAQPVFLSGRLFVSCRASSNPGHYAKPRKKEKTLMQTAHLPVPFLFHVCLTLLIIGVASLGAEAATLTEIYPEMTSSLLADALLEKLPEGTLLQADSVIIQQTDLDQMKSDMKEKIKEDTFVSELGILQNLALDKILEAEVLRDKNKSDYDENELKVLFQEFAQSKVAHAIVTDEEADAFYAANQELFGGRSLADLKPAIKQTLQREKSQAAWIDYLKSLGSSIPIRLQADWVKADVERFSSSPVETARKTGKPVFVDFSASWCGPCKRLKPIVESLQKKYADKMVFVILDIDEQPFLAQHYGASSVPHLFFYDAEGRAAGDILGFVPEETLVKKFAELGVQ